MAPGPINALGWFPALGLLRVSSNERVALQFGLTPDWLTAGYGPGFGEKVSIDFGLRQVASAGQFGLSVFYP